MNIQASILQSYMKPSMTMLTTVFIHFLGPLLPDLTVQVPATLSNTNAVRVRVLPSTHWSLSDRHIHVCWREGVPVASCHQEAPGACCGYIYAHMQFPSVENVDPRRMVSDKDRAGHGQRIDSRPPHGTDWLHVDSADSIWHRTWIGCGWLR